MTSIGGASPATKSVPESNERPLFIEFFPPAFIQRRVLVLATLRSAVPKLSSLLDVGTGDGSLLTYLRGCDDEIPLTRMVGIDPDEKEIASAVKNTKPTRLCHSDPRWRPLQISLLTGGVVNIVDEAGTYDVVTAIEVLEHLDPADVEALPRVCLGQLRPQLCIFTTPNRDFNEVFRRIEGTAGRWFVLQPARAGVPYKMRHDDHRFEMSRTEFQFFCDNQATRYGYRVEYIGVGSIENAFSGQKDWLSTFPEEDLDATFGYSTQVAIFTKLDSSLPVASDFTADVLIQPHAVDRAGLQHIVTYDYPWSNDDKFPPSPEHTAILIVGAEGWFRPYFESNVNNEEEVFHRHIDCKEFYETCYEMQRSSRFRYDVFLESIMALKDRVLSADPPSEDTQAERHRDVDHEPRATFISARVSCADRSKICIEYKYDVTSFFPIDEGDSLSASTISADWDAISEAEPVMWTT